LQETQMHHWLSVFSACPSASRCALHCVVRCTTLVMRCISQHMRCCNICSTISVQSRMAWVGLT
jgi:hypothetical protein